MEKSLTVKSPGDCAATQKQRTFMERLFPVVEAEFPHTTDGPVNLWAFDMEVEMRWVDRIRLLVSGRLRVSSKSSSPMTKKSGYDVTTTQVVSVLPPQWKKKDTLT